MRQALYERYKLMSDNDLLAIINSDEYEEEAKDVAREILNGDRAEYRRKQVEAMRAEQIQHEKRSAQLTDPLYDDIHRIAGDIRFIRNYIIISTVSAAAIVVALIIIGSILRSLLL